MNTCKHHHIQHHKLSCGPCSIAILLDILGEGLIDEKLIAKRCRTTKNTGTTPFFLKRWLKKALPHCSVTSAQVDKSTMKQYLSRWPMIVLYMEERLKNPHHSDKITGKEYGLHYTVLTSYTEKNNTIHMINPFWFEADVDLDIWRPQFCLENKFLARNEKLLQYLWVIRSRSVFFIEKKTHKNDC